MVESGGPKGFHFDANATPFHGFFSYVNQLVDPGRTSGSRFGADSHLRLEEPRDKAFPGEMAAVFGNTRTPRTFPGQPGTLDLGHGVAAARKVTMDMRWFKKLPWSRQSSRDYAEILLGTFLGRKPDPTSLEYYTSLIYKRASLTRILGEITQSQEYKSNFGFRKSPTRSIGPAYGLVKSTMLTQMKPK